MAADSEATRAQSPAQLAEVAKATKAADSAQEGVRSHRVNVDHPDRKARTPKAPAQPRVGDMKFSAEGRYLNAQLYIADGLLRVPQEVLEVCMALPTHVVSHKLCLLHPPLLIGLRVGMHEHGPCMQ